MSRGEMGADAHAGFEHEGRVRVAKQVRARDGRLRHDRIGGRSRAWQRRADWRMIACDSMEAAPTDPSGEMDRPTGTKSASRSQMLTFLVVTATGWILFALDYFHLARYRTVALDLAVASATLLLMPWAWRERSPERIRTIVHLAAALTSAGLIVAALLSGQSRAMSLWYLVAVPPAMAYMLSRRAALAWSSVVVVGIAIVQGSEKFLSLQPEFVADGTELFRGQVLLVGTVLLFAALARHASDEQLAAAEEREDVIRKQRDDLARVLDEARNAEEKARFSESTFRGIVERMHDVFYRADETGKIQMISPSIERFGYRLEETIGRHVGEFFLDPEDRQAYLPTLLDTGEIREQEIHLRRPDGEVRIMSANMRLLRDEQSRPIGSEGILRDITERRRQQETLRFIQFTVDHAGEAVFWADRSARLIRVNAAACKLLGYTQDEMLGLTVLDLHPRMTSQDWSGHWAMLKNLGATVGDSFQRTKSGELVPVELALNHLSFEGKEYMCAFVHDLTERRRIEEELREARDRAESLSRAKSEAIAAMGHEIRTPLTGIVGVAGLLSDSGLRPDQLEYLNAIQSSGESLLVLINDLLDLSRIEAGRMTLEAIPLSFGQVVSQVVELLGDTASRKQIDLHYEIRAAGLGAVVGDPTRLRQVLLNLIGNAIKFTAKGSVRVTAEATLVDEESVSIRFEVEDTGIGIGEDELADLFRPYSQANTSTSRRYGGTGLGLAICRQLVELMGGEIGVRSTPGSGSVFWFVVRLGKAHVDFAPPEGGVLAGKRAMIVDASPADRIVLKALLSSWGVACETAETAGDALNILASTTGRFDFILLESDLGDDLGLEVVGEIRAGAAAAGAQVVLLHSTGRPGLPGAARVAGVAVSMAKPVPGPQLYQCLAGLVAAGQEPVRVVPAGGAGAAADAIGRARILVAEDIPVNQLLARRMLEKLDLHVDVVVNGVAAVAAMREKQYDLVLMDKEMPEMNGIEATRAIRREEKDGRRRTPIVALTAANAQSDRDECLEAGMDDFLAKPISRQALTAILERWIG